MGANHKILQYHIVEKDYDVLHDKDVTRILISYHAYKRPERFVGGRYTAYGRIEVVEMVRQATLQKLLYVGCREATEQEELAFEARKKLNM